MGVLAPNGNTLVEFWDSLIEGRSGLGIATSVDVTDLPVKVVAELKNFDPRRYMDFKEAKRMARFSQVGVAAARMAIEQSGIDLGSEDRTRIGCEVGTGIGGFKEISEEIEAVCASGRARSRADLAVLCASGHPQHGLLPDRDPVRPRGAQQHRHHGLCRVHPGARQCLPRVATLATPTSCWRVGRRPTSCRFGLASFAAMKVLSTYSDDPLKASRPFDAHRDGFVPGEGAGMLVLETLEHAQGRQAEIFAELIGFAVTDDAFHIVMPEEDGDGPARAMARALEDAHVKPGGGRLHQRPRHLHPAKRQDRDGGDQAGLR